MPNNYKILLKDISMSHLTYPHTHDNISTYSLPIESSLLESISSKLGCFAGRSVSYLRSKQGKRRAVQAYILSETLITAIAVISMFIAGLYLPASLLTLMLAYLIYASFGVF
jgi:hypothetical protein